MQLGLIHYVLYVLYMSYIYICVLGDKHTILKFLCVSEAALPIIYCHFIGAFLLQTHQAVVLYVDPKYVCIYTYTYTYGQGQGT